MFDSLSDVQREIVFNSRGRFVVRACPGSGKTYTVAARLARLLGNWEQQSGGIATISFTNAAWIEIQKKLEEDFLYNCKVKYPHFLGTIDSFINNYIFLPFGHKVMGCDQRPELVGGNISEWKGRNYTQDQFTNVKFLKNGDLEIINPRMVGSNLTISNLKRMKFAINKGGFATQDDSEYYSLKLLKKYPELSKSLVKRFPFVMIDEAQDTNELQMEIINNLVDHGLSELILVGDPDQAIFEWNEAKPKLFLQKCHEWVEISLNENRRSSQKICDFYYKISSLEETSEAVNEDVREFEVSPIIMEYSEQNIQNTIENFLQLCQQHNINMNNSNIKILCRSHNMVRKISGIDTNTKLFPWQPDKLFCSAIAKGRYLFDKGEISKGIKSLELGILKFIGNLNMLSVIDKNKILTEKDFDQIEWRIYLYELMEILPKTDIILSEWIRLANTSLNTYDSDLKLNLSIKRNSRQCAYSELSFDDIFINEREITIYDNIKVGTVHSVKGESIDAVLIFWGNRAANNMTYSRILDTDISECEEKRIVYVAITRAKRILVIAVPEDQSEHWQNKFLN